MHEKLTLVIGIFFVESKEFLKLTYINYYNPKGKRKQIYVFV